MPSHAENEAARRREKLEDMRAQIKDGSLVVRQVTEAERRRNPERPVQARPHRRRG